MQDMSCIITEPAANAASRVLRSDVHLDKAVGADVTRKPRAMPKNNKHAGADRRKQSTVSRSPQDANNSSDDVDFHHCGQCDAAFATSEDLDKHKRSHDDDEAAEEDSSLFACKNCDRVFATNAALERHSTAAHCVSLQCKMCDMTFTTGSGLLRHEKSHKTSCSSNYSDSEDSSEGSKVRRKRRSSSAEEDHHAPKVRKRMKTINNNVIDETNLKCVVCKRQDFDSLDGLEAHMRRKHPNFKTIDKHDSVSGFDDCTFIDFSSQKFPEIARTVCEQSVHKSITDQTFRCGLCARDFPCESALEIHSKNCNAQDEGDSRHRSDRPAAEGDENYRRDDFFANLDLQNKSPSRPEVPKVKIQPDPYEVRRFVDTSKDLADIQSILSVTSSGGLLEQLTQKTRGEHKEQHQQQHEPEEVQDVFAAEFRKMKLRGEFPCRLCTAIFPNLRALKGHNRVHLNGNGTGPYRCNMCPHTSLDKAALVRHMRTHNGDRPYECAVCNYAFTTKANCERHLRNRHSKITREDVKRSIIYHPSEDPNNDEVNNKLNISREELKRPQLYVPPEIEKREEIKVERTTPIPHFQREAALSFQDRGLAIPIPRDLSIVIPQPRELLKSHCAIEPVKIPKTEDVVPKIKVKGFHQLTQIPEYMESDNEKNATSDDEMDVAEDSYAEKDVSEAPMDLSTTEFQENVLDLSKKKRDRVDENASFPIDSAVDYAAKKNDIINSNLFAKNMLEKSQELLLARHNMLKGVSKLDPAANLYHLSQLYGRNPFTGMALPSSFPLPPYFLPPNPFLAPQNPLNSQNIVEMSDRWQKEIMRGLQLSGGGLVNIDHNIMNNIALVKERYQQALNNMTNDLKNHAPPMMKTEEDVKPQQLHINTDTPATIPFSSAMHSPIIPSPKTMKKETAPSQSPNSVKMVIKNGVLMPKQKQRRYRTERPFSCEHCSARFTLRSNMERHIKQQHPQYWSQRQRSSLGGLPRKSPISLVPQNITVPQSLPLNYDNRMNFVKNMHPRADVQEDERKQPSPPNNHVISSMNKNFMISDEVKYAILAQQLKSSQSTDLKSRIDSMVNGTNEEEDEEDALVIDEESNDDKKYTKNENNLKAKKVAQEILINAKSQNEIAKDFEWKITGNLISKNPQQLQKTQVSEIPTFVCDMTSEKHKENGPSAKSEEGDLVSVSKLLDNAATQDPFGKYFKSGFSKSSESLHKDVPVNCEGSEEDEEGLVASSGSTSEGNNSGSDENRSESETVQVPQKKKSAYSLAPNRVSCPYCHRKFPWSSSLRRHVLTHTGQKPYKCPHCPLLFTTKSNCDRHLLRKHGNSTQQTITTSSASMETNIPNSADTTSQNFMMRNVPERPYKCASCPSSTFSTLSNLKKHMHFKHDISMPDSYPESPKSESRRESYDNEHPSSSDSEKSPHQSEIESSTNKWENQAKTSSTTQDIPTNVQNSDLPFKCHLCEGSYVDRDAALEHIKENHRAEYDLLVAKGALDMGMTFNEELTSSGHKSEGCDEHVGEENVEQLRGKFPDYANRKVICAFCMRRFWSAEDLRRHMRTHNGERPFSCDVCCRRFTLKHSMLRHRKKHSMYDNRSCEDLSTVSGDEDAPSPTTNSSTNSNRTVSPMSNMSYISPANASTPLTSKNHLSSYQIAIHAKNVSSPEIPSNVNNNNSPPAIPAENKYKNDKRSTAKTIRYSTDNPESEVESGGDLIGNLLGISDKGMINKLLSSADEAAKLLGVKK